MRLEQQRKGVSHCLKRLVHFLVGEGVSNQQQLLIVPAGSHTSCR